MSRRVVIITEIIAPYRIPVFNALAQHDGIDLHVIFLAENDRTQRQWLVYKDEIRFSYQVLPSWRRRVGRHSLLAELGSKNGAAASGTGFHHLRRLQLCRLVASHGLGATKSRAIRFVGGEHGQRLAQQLCLDRIP